jgi:outer membrane protein assembly factor BamB
MTKTRPTASFRKIFSSACVSRTKENLCGIPFGVYRNKPNGIPDKIAFPRLKAGKSNFSGMTIFICAAILLAACSGSNNKIGSTVKGTRVAILDRAKTLQADSAAQDVKPQAPEPVANAAWAQAGYDSSHVMPNAALGGHPEKKWSASIGNGSSSDFKILARPVVKDGVVYAMDAEGSVAAVDAAKGDVKWSVETTPKGRDESAIGGGVGVDGDIVYVTTGFGEVLALNAADGKIKWRRALSNPIRAAPAIAGGRVYAVSIDNQLSALNAQTGEVEWQHRGIAESATLMGAASPAVVGDSVVVAYGSGEIFNLRAENGRVSWSYALTTPTQIGALPAIADIRGLPVIDRDRVFAISHSGRMAAIDHRTGDRDWEADIGGINTPVVAGDTVFILSNDGQLAALSRDNGRILWVQEMQHLSDPEDRDSDPVFWTGPVLGGGRLWLTNSLGQLVGFSLADGKQTDKIDIDDPIYVPPVIANGAIYVVTDDGDLVALR